MQCVGFVDNQATKSTNLQVHFYFYFFGANEGTSLPRMSTGSHGRRNIQRRIGLVPTWH